MPNLVGIGNSQVPTNAMLGGLAYKDSVGEIDIDKIKAKISYDAQSSGGTGLFVYDTRKDSDGGAWRHRTQNTTWYNEGVSSKRGARKEFPSVAVLVVSEDDDRAIHIFDGDDPNLPMWMIIDSSDSQWPLTEFSSITALNGIIALGSDSSEQPLYETRNRLDLYYFISDKIESSGGSSGGNYYGTIHGLVNRRDHARSRATAGLGNSVYNLVHMRVKDVAMTVLPGAPIDETTGLPVPTIAVATAGGISIIKDDKSVVNITVSAALLHHEPRNVAFLGGSGENGGYAEGTSSSARLLWTEGNNYDLEDRGFLNAPIPTSSVVTTHSGSLPSGYIHYGIGRGATNIYSTLALNTVLSPEYPSPRERKFQIPGPDGTIILGCKHYLNGGLEQIRQDINSPSNGSLNAITTSYNTGWMHGDCKLAALSDTDDTDLTGTNLVGNGDFLNGTTGWTAHNAAISVSGAILTVSDSSNAGADSQAYRTVSGLTSGKVYYVAIRHKSNTQHRLWISTASGPLSSGNVISKTYLSSYATSYRQDYYTFTASSTSVTVALQVDGTGTAYYDWIYINESIDFDRSASGQPAYDQTINGNPLQVFGTIEKHAVATGADLMGYRPSSGSLGNNYLRLPLTSTEFDISNDWSINFWAKNNGNTAENYSGFEIAPDDISSNSAYSIIALSMYMQNDGVIGLRGMNGNANQDATGKPLATAGDWRCINIVQESGITYLYIDGELNVSKSVSYTNPSTQYSLYIFGWSYSTTRYFGRRQVDFSLFRLSESAPSAEKIKKMYEDEKKLFVENAKCTLYGTSDVVTAIAHDDKTNIVHAGTSSGRSEFRGLNRINNTTTAVTTAISASDGFVAEQ